MRDFLTLTFSDLRAWYFFVLARVLRVVTLGMFGKFTYCMNQDHFTMKNIGFWNFHLHMFFIFDFLAFWKSFVALDVMEPCLGLSVCELTSKVSITAVWCVLALELRKRSTVLEKSSIWCILRKSKKKKCTTVKPCCPDGKKAKHRKPRYLIN